MPARPVLLRERDEIRCGIVRGESVTEIADRIGRHRCTVSAEISRNGGRDAHLPCRAQDRAVLCRKRPKILLFERHPELADHVAARLEEQDSPMTIAVDIGAGAEPQTCAALAGRSVVFHRECRWRACVEVDGNRTRLSG